MDDKDYEKIIQDEKDEADKWWEEHGDEVDPEIEDEIGNGTVVSYEDAPETGVGDDDDDDDED